MAIRYKVDVMERLKAAGYSSTKLRRERLLGESYMTQLRHSDLVSWSAIDTICRLLNCQPGDLLEHVSADNDVEAVTDKQGTVRV